jgi:hypothetical protein
MGTSSWGDAITSFLGSSLGGQISKLLTGVAVLLIIGGCSYSIFKHHKEGLGKVLRRCVEFIILGVILAVPSIWGGIAGLVANLVQGAASYLGGL